MAIWNMTPIPLSLIHISNSLAELVVFGRLAGEQATERAATAGNGNEAAIEAQAAEMCIRDRLTGDRQPSTGSLPGGSAAGDSDFRAAYLRR